MEELEWLVYQSIIIYIKNYRPINYKSTWINSYIIRTKHVLINIFHTHYSKHYYLFLQDA